MKGGIELNEKRCIRLKERGARINRAYQVEYLYKDVESGEEFYSDDNGLVERGYAYKWVEAGSHRRRVIS